MPDANGACLLASIVEPSPRSINPGGEVVVEVAVEGLVDKHRIELGETIELFDLEVVLVVKPGSPGMVGGGGAERVSVAVSMAVPTPTRRA